MHHPGPPRFVAVGEAIELAPRDPDPDAAYAWTVANRPDGSTVTVGDAAVEHLEPDVEGTYVVHLSAPDGGHELTVRAFGSSRAPATGGESGVSAGQSGFESGEGASGRSGVSRGSGSGGVSVPTGDGGRPRVRLEPAIEGAQAVVRATPIPHPDGTETPSDLDVEFLLDDRDAVGRDAVAIADTELRVPLAGIGDRLRVHAVSVGDTGYSVPDAVEFARGEATGTAVSSAGDVSASHLYDPPAWAEDAVIYEIYVRTFAGQNADDDGEGAGSDERSAFDAIIDRLDHIESLGVNTLWLTPVLENDHAPHGYNITDFFSIAADLGTRSDYERLVEAAHDRGIAVLFDLVCNHSARTHPHFQAAVADPDSEYHEWYEWRGPGEPETYFEWEHIANFDFTHLPVRRHLLDAIDQWAPLVDGFRIDMAWAVPNTFWREVHDRAKAIDDDFLLLDETIPYIPDFQGGCFDMHFDSTTYAALRRVGNGAPAEEILDAVDERAEIGFPPHAGFMLYAENHDETRYIVECGRAAAAAAAGALFTLPGAPMLYAGQEFGQRGKRDDLAWDHTDEALQSFVRQLATTRREEPALGPEGDFKRVEYDIKDGDADRVVAFGRVHTDDAVAVVLHFGSGTATVALPAATGTRDAVSGRSIGTAGGLTVDTVAVIPADPDTVLA
ncbi:alpha-amylase MalA [Halorhabdus sp. BNX81]|uniref:alpha-amylase MalA n=1 Tax=Halorhabdus sp. BNX81 TaxID=2980181 RepID=UPI0023DD3055|nr:alpha-amylase MalA [Halorhabdus sp. BNX81]WEL20608.1 Cyclomaltodextrinase, glycosyl hydrolase family 13 [Halorhabdus sp. BNX81]